MSLSVPFFKKNWIPDRNTVNFFRHDTNVSNISKILVGHRDNGNQRGKHHCKVKTLTVLVLKHVNNTWRNDNRVIELVLWFWVLAALGTVRNVVRCGDKWWPLAEVEIVRISEMRRGVNCIWVVRRSSYEVSVKLRTFSDKLLNKWYKK